MIPSDSSVQNVLTIAALQDFYPDHKEGFRGGLGTIPESTFQRQHRTQPLIYF